MTQVLVRLILNHLIGVKNRRKSFTDRKVSLLCRYVPEYCSQNDPECCKQHRKQINNLRDCGVIRWMTVWLFTAVLCTPPENAAPNSSIHAAL